VRFSLFALIPCSLVVLAACEKPCPKGQQRYGAKCVMSPVYDAGLDVDAGRDSERGDGGAPSDSTMDGGDLASCAPPTCHPCDQDPCGAGGVCSETDTSFECACKVGFSGKRCQVDVCELDPCANGECVRRASGRECKCEAGWTGEVCDSNTDASLGDLTVSAGKLFPAFKPSIQEYSVDLGISASEIALVPTVNVPGGAAIKIDGVNAESGATTELYALDLNTTKAVTIQVTADDGTKLSYRVTIRRSFMQQSFVTSSVSQANQFLGGSGETLSLSRSVGLSAGVLVVGAPDADDGSDLASGRLSFFDNANREWQPQFPPPLDPPANAWLGYSVAVSKHWIIASAPNATVSDTGAERSGFVRIIEHTPEGISSYSKFFGNPEPVADAGFGMDVAAWDNTIVVSSPGRAAYVLRYLDGAWGPVITIAKPTDGSALFGVDVAVEGDIIVLGAPDYDDPGSVFVYDVSSGIAEPAGHLTDPTLGKNFGLAVGISGGRIATLGGGMDGLSARQVVVYERVGNDWVAGSAFGLDRDFDFPKEPVTNTFGANGMAFQGNRILVGARYATGAVYLFGERSDGWHLDAYLQSPAPSSNGMFGAGVAMDGDTVAISEPGNDTGAEDSGGVYVYGIDCSKVPLGAKVPGC